MQELRRVLNIWLNMSEQYVNMPEMSEFSIIDRVLNMYHAIHNARSL